MIDDSDSIFEYEQKGDCGVRRDADEQYSRTLKLTLIPNPYAGARMSCLAVHATAHTLTP